jgi:hypothetical protein
MGMALKAKLAVVSIRLSLALLTFERRGASSFRWLCNVLQFPSGGSQVKGV